MYGGYVCFLRVKYREPACLTRTYFWELENILVEPAKDYPNQTKRKSVDKARVISAEKLKCIPLPVTKEPAEP